MRVISARHLIGLAVLCGALTFGLVIGNDAVAQSNTAAGENVLVKDPTTDTSGYGRGYGFGRLGRGGGGQTTRGSTGGYLPGQYTGDPRCIPGIYPQQTLCGQPKRSPDDRSCNWTGICSVTCDRTANGGTRQVVRCDRGILNGTTNTNNFAPRRTSP